jgi:hypothetical protein
MDGVRAVLKSFGFALVGASLSFVFLAMITVPLVAAWSRLHNANTPLQAGDVVVEPFGLLRVIGLPIAAAVLVTCFAHGLRKFSHVVNPPSAARAAGAPMEHRS